MAPSSPSQPTGSVVASRRFVHATPGLLLASPRFVHATPGLLLASLRFVLVWPCFVVAPGSPCGLGAAPGGRLAAHPLGCAAGAPLPRYLLSGGRQRVGAFVRRDEWTSFDAAVLLEFDSDTGGFSTVLEYRSPPGHCPAVDPSHIFKAASWDGGRLLLCTQTEVLVFDPVARRIERTISLPCFNDVHHVARLNAPERAGGVSGSVRTAGAGAIHVVSTGLDAVFVLDEHGTVTDTLPAVPGAPWTRCSPDTDYRLAATTKPHASHPNFIFVAGGTRWITRFEQRDALPLDGGPPVPIADAPIHDGVLRSRPDGESVWFTAVNGQLIEMDAGTRCVLRRWDLNSWRSTPDVPLGWCRGVLPEDDRVLVGFSRLRPTKFVQNLAWLRPALKRPEPLPCRISAYDVRAGRELESWTLEGAGMSAVFAILPAGR